MICNDMICNISIWYATCGTFLFLFLFFVFCFCCCFFPANMTLTNKFAQNMMSPTHLLRPNAHTPSLRRIELTWFEQLRATILQVMQCRRLLLCVCTVREGHPVVMNGGNDCPLRLCEVRNAWHNRRSCIRAYQDRGLPRIFEVPLEINSRHCIRICRQDIIV